MAKQSLPTDTEAALDFLGVMFDRERTSHKIFLCSLSNINNDPDQPPPRELVTRDAKRIVEFVAAWDRPGRGMFFSVGITDGKRNKDAIKQTIGLHCDIDFKGIEATAAEIEAAIARLKCKPTVRVNSGHGVHLYWLFVMAIDAQAHRNRIEELLRLLCNHVAGDTQVCEISRLMRLPGTHNTKFDSKVPVTCVTLDGPRYELKVLEEWLGRQPQPLLQRRVGSSSHGLPDAPTDDNPFVRQAHEQGYHPPIDVDARLAAMTIGGAGDTGVHTTQRDVAASLLSRGEKVDDVVERIITATQRLKGTENWNWKIEVRKVHNLCLTWLSKKPEILEKQEQRQEEQQEAAGDNVHKIHKPATSPKTGGTPKKHTVLALGVLQAIADRGERLLITPEGAYWYSDQLWALQDEKDLRRRLNRELEVGAEVLSIVTNNKLINEAREWLLRRPEIYRRDIVFDAHEKVPVINGLVDPRTGDITAPVQEHYATWRIEHAYDPEAKCSHWLLMLNSVLADRTPEERREYIDLIQELLGVGLVNVRSKSLSRALVFVGAQNTGKSGLLDVMGGLFGSSQNLTPLSALDSNHGLMPFLQRRPWVLHEAFDEGVWHLSSIVKTIISGDPIAINVKNGPIISHRMQAPIFWATNHPPAFKETTRAIIERMVIVQCRETFEQERPKGVADIAQKKGYTSPAQFVLETEMTGVLAWAIEGLRRALKRGHLVTPKDSKLALEELQRESNVAIGFCETCVEYKPAMMVSIPDFNAAFRSWYIEEHSTERVPSAHRLGRAMTAMADKRIAIDRELRTKSRRYYGCIALSPEGLRHWKNAVTSDAFVFKGRTASTTEPEGNPNTIVPDDWKTNPTLQRANLVSTMTNHGSPGGDQNTKMTNEVTKKPQDGSDQKSPGKSKQPRF